MEISNDLKEEVLMNSKLVENLEVTYKKKKKINGKLASVHHNPFQVKIFDEENKVDHSEHIIDFENAQEFSIYFFDGTIKVFKDIE